MFLDIFLFNTCVFEINLLPLQRFLSKKAPFVIFLISKLGALFGTKTERYLI